MAKKTDYTRFPGAELTRLLGLTRGAITKAVTSGRLAENPDKTIDLTAPASRLWLERRTSRRVERDPEKREAAERLLHTINKKFPSLPATVPAPRKRDDYPENDVLRKLAAEAELLAEIKKTELLNERVEQERLVTLQKKKELAPLPLVKFVGTFCESAITRCHSVVYEAMPEVSALILSKSEAQAVALLRRRLETVFDTCVQDVIKSLRPDYDVEEHITEGRRIGKKIVSGGAKK